MKKIKRALIIFALTLVMASLTGLPAFAEEGLGGDSGQSGEFDPNANPDSGQSGEFDPNANPDPGQSGEFDPNANPDPGQNGEFDPNANPGGEIISEITATDAAGPRITAEPEAVAYVIEGSGYAAPVYSVTAGLPVESTATAITFTWYVNGTVTDEITISATAGEEKMCTYTASGLAAQPFGVYPVYCVVSCTTETTDESGTTTTTTNSNTSLTVNFIVCRGVQVDSVLTFSDVHESFSNIGTAIGNIMGTDGMIPALIICTGDWANNHYAGGDSTSENYAVTTNTYIKRLKAQFGGIDAVFVSGNHDNAAAAVDATKAANLGATAELDDGAGVIFDSATARVNGMSSKAVNNLVVYGINFEAVQTESGYSYEKVISDLDNYLGKLSENYAGQLIVISSHTGLHVLEEWGGENMYNVDKSAEMVELLNRYSDAGMNLMFLFGHDHSKGESEFFRTPGDAIASTVAYAEKSTRENTIRFPYGQAGYITGNIGGSQKYTEITWTNLGSTEAGEICRIMTDTIGSQEVSTSRIVAIPLPAPETSPDMGDESNLLFWIAVLFASLATAFGIWALPRPKNTD